MMARNFQLGETVAEIRDLGPSTVMALDCSGDTVLLACKRYLQFVKLQKPDIECCIPRRNVKWEVNAAQWNPHESNASTFAITKNQVAEVFRVSAGSAELYTTLQSHTRSITDLDWSPTVSDLILTCSADSNAFLWDVRHSKTPSRTFGTSSSCSASQVKWNKFDEHIFATSHDRDIRVWDTRRDDRPLCISGHMRKIHCLDWSCHNNRILASASEDETVKFWDHTLSSSQKLNVGELKNNNNAPVWKARFTPFAHGLLTIDVSPMRRDDSVRLWNIEDMNNPVHQYGFVGHTDFVTEFQWQRSKASDNYSLVTWSRDCTLKIWKYETARKGSNMNDTTTVENPYKETNGNHISSSGYGHSSYTKLSFKPDLITNGHSNSVENLLNGDYDDDDDADSLLVNDSPAHSYSSRRGSRGRLSQPFAADLFTVHEVVDDTNELSLSADLLLNAAADSSAPAAHNTSSSPSNSVIPAAATLTDTNDDDDDDDDDDDFEV